jgi:hypothetical protein
LNAAAARLVPRLDRPGAFPAPHAPAPANVLYYPEAGVYVRRSTHRIASRFHGPSCSTAAQPWVASTVTSSALLSAWGR